MADSIAEIRKIFRDKDVPLGSDDVWEVQGVAVVKHKALERLAVKLDIDWREPKILRCEADEAVILVMGGIGAHVEWSIGEARIVAVTIDTGRKNKWGKPIYEAPLGAIGNYQITPKQAAYPWAMAEKRGKDRVILKLAGIDAYSDEESDDFSRGAVQEADPGPSSDALYMKQALANIDKFDNEAALVDWYTAEKETRQRMLDTEQVGELFRKFQAKRKALRPSAQASEAA